LVVRLHFHSRSFVFVHSFSLHFPFALAFCLISTRTLTYSCLFRRCRAPSNLPGSLAAVAAHFRDGSNASTCAGLWTGMMLVSQHVCSFIGYIPSIQSPNPVPWFAMPWAFHPFDCASPPLPFLLPSSFIHPSLISLPPDALRSGLHCAHCDPRRCLSSGRACKGPIHEEVDPTCRSPC
jgi:hypothetical protein